MTQQSNTLPFPNGEGKIIESRDSHRTGSCAIQQTAGQPSHQSRFQRTAANPFNRDIETDAFQFN
jgi:hypothetical protein